MTHEDLITSDPAIMVGKPIIKGTRITVELIVEKVFAGQTIEQILDDYPHLTRAGIEAALEFALEAVRVTEDFTSSVAGTQPTPNGPARIEGSGSGSGSYYVGNDGRYLGGSWQQQSSLKISGSFATQPLNVAAAVALRRSTAPGFPGATRNLPASAVKLRRQAAPAHT